MLKVLLYSFPANVFLGNEFVVMLLLGTYMLSPVQWQDIQIQNGSKAQAQGFDHLKIEWKCVILCSFKADYK